MFISPSARHLATAAFFSSLLITPTTQASTHDHREGRPHADDHAARPSAPRPSSTSDAGPAGAKEASKPVLRLTLGDATGRVSVHHAATGRELLATTLPAPASSLVTLGDGRHVAAAMGTGNAVQILDAGSWTEPHDDHTHTYVAAPRVVGSPLASTKPSHIVGEGDDVVVFGDGSGTADRYSLASIAAGKPVARPTSAAFPHHGVGVPFGDGLLVSAAPGAAARPDAVTHVDGAGRTTRFDGCPGLHGETSGEGWAAFGCADGTLLLEGSPLQARKLAYPAAAGALRVATWGRSRTGRHLVGALGTAGVLIIDRKTGTQHLTPLPGTVHAVAVDASASTAVALTRDGRLHRIAIGTGTVTTSAAALAPFTAPTGQPAPRLTAAGGRVAVTEPAASRAAVLATKDLRQVTSIRLGAVPTQVALTGAVPTH